MYDQGTPRAVPRMGLASLPDELIDHIKSYLSGDDKIAFLVSLKQTVDHIRVEVWGSRQVAIVCDPGTKRLVTVSVDVNNPPPCVIRVLPGFEQLFSLSLENVAEAIYLGKVCPAKLGSLRLQRCTVDADDPSPPKELGSISLEECRVMLGPAGRQWSLLSSPGGAVSWVRLTRCSLVDVHCTGALPITSPRVSTLGIGSCTFLTKCTKSSLFGELSKSVELGYLSFQCPQQSCRRTGQGSAPPLDIVSRDFLRNVAPQLTKLVLQNASRGTLQDACLMLRKLRDLDLTHWNCCQYHQLLDISSSVAAQLTRLQIDCQASVQGSIHDGSEPLLLVKFQFLIELTAFEKQAREAARLLEACQSCPRLQQIDIVFLGWPLCGVMTFDARIQLSLPKLKRIKTFWVFSELDLRGCSALSALVITGAWHSQQSTPVDACDAIRSVASCVTPPKADGHWAAVRAEGSSAKQERIPSIHWHAPNIRCDASEKCTVGR